MIRSLTVSDQKRHLLISFMCSFKNFTVDQALTCPKQDTRGRKSFTNGEKLFYVRWWRTCLCLASNWCATTVLSLHNREYRKLRFRDYWHVIIQWKSSSQEDSMSASIEDGPKDLMCFSYGVISGRLEKVMDEMLENSTKLSSRKSYSTIVVQSTFSAV